MSLETVISLTGACWCNEMRQMTCCALIGFLFVERVDANILLTQNERKKCSFFSKKESHNGSELMPPVTLLLVSFFCCHFFPSVSAQRCKEHPLKLKQWHKNEEVIRLRVNFCWRVCGADFYFANEETWRPKSFKLSVYKYFSFLLPHLHFECRQQLFSSKMLHCL